MAFADESKRDLFMDNFRRYRVLELLAWIIELLPQSEFDDIVKRIKADG